MVDRFPHQLLTNVARVQVIDLKFIVLAKELVLRDWSIDPVTDGPEFAHEATEKT